MLNKSKLFIIIMLFLLSGCYHGITGKVVDGLTGNPIEGAVVLAQWTTTVGIGLSHHNVSKIIETETDKAGLFSLSGAYSPFVNPPEMVIYKKGFVPWRNDMTFEEMETYDKIIWQDDLTYKLESWRDSYSKLRLDSFVGYGIIGASFNKTPKFSTVQSDLSGEAQEEVDLKKKVLKNRSNL